MASKRHLRRSQCERKRPYSTPEDAEHARNFQRWLEGGRELNVYACPFGRHWHTGHRDKSLAAPHGGKFLSGGRV